MSLLRRVAPTAAAAALALTILAGCTPTEDPGAAPSEAPAATPSAEPTTGPTDQPNAHPVDATCDQLVSADTMYAFNPNFGLLEGYTPASGSYAETALAYEGVACRWQNQTNGHNIDISVAQLDEDALTALKNAAFSESQMVPTYGEEAYFDVEGGVGTAQVFQGPYWIVAESAAFFEPGDATELVQSTIAGLGA